MLIGCAASPGATETHAAPVATTTASASAAPKRAPVVVALVVDQLAAWEAAERFDDLPKNGGFARLRHEGTYVRDMRYAHAVTETAAGHSALFTGSPPYRSGIVANELVDPKSRERVSAFLDPTAHVVTAQGPTDEEGIGLPGLAVDTIADVLRKTRPHALIVSLSIKDRGAVFGGGRHPDATLWYDTTRDAFVTSSAFSPEFPSWARFLDTAALQKMREQPWTLLDPVFVSSHARQPDAQTGESEVFGFGKTFPHSFAASTKPTKAFRASPRADQAVLELAAAALDRRNPAEPMLLAVSLSSFDYVNHFFGPDSWESWDDLLRLDAALADFFALLDRKVGADGWSVVLSGDHGGPPLPELPISARPWCAPGVHDFWQRPCRNVGRVFPDALRDTLEKAARKALGKSKAGSWVLGVASPYVFYTHQNLAPEKRKKLDAVVTATLLAQPEIDRVYPPRAPGSTCPPEADESLDALVCRSMSPSLTDALFFVTKQGSFVDTDYDLGKGMSHGGPYLFDRSVPLFVRAPGRVLAGVTLKDETGFGAYVRSIAALLDIDPPAGASEARAIVNPR
ncbi:MAG TPA: alkaline phosphatase family protein [Polyangiaceae bacterium]|jgi:hypothetical protein